MDSGFVFSFLQDLTAIHIGGLSLGMLLSALIIFLICLIAIRIGVRVARRTLEKSKLDHALRSFILSAVRVALWVLAIICVAGSLGIPTASLVAGVSVVGLALSLSVQGIMTNVFSGMTLLGTKPFAAGDFVEVNGVQGTVKDINLFYTSLLTIDNKTVHIPNSEVSSAKIINFSSEPRRRMDQRVTASYEAPTETVKKAILEALYADERILCEPEPLVEISAFQSSAVEYVVRAWVETKDYWPAIYAFNANLRTSFASNGVEMTYDHVNVHVIRDEN